MDGAVWRPITTPSKSATTRAAMTTTISVPVTRRRPRAIPSCVALIVPPSSSASLVANGQFNDGPVVDSHDPYVGPRVCQVRVRLDLLAKAGRIESSNRHALATDGGNDVGAHPDGSAGRDEQRPLHRHPLLSRI